MKIKFNCNLVAIIPVGFETALGETVEYNELYFVNENDEGRRELVSFNSKVVVPELVKGFLAEGKIATVDIEVDIDSKGEKKPKLISIA